MLMTPSFKRVWKRDILFILWLLFFPVLFCAANENRDLGSREKPALQGIENTGTADAGRDDFPEDNALDFLNDNGGSEGDFRDYDTHFTDSDSEEGIPETGSTGSSGYLKGRLTAEGVYNFAHDAPARGETDHRHLSGLTGELYLEYGSNLFKSWDIVISGKGFYNLAWEINGRDDYTDGFLDEYEKSFETDRFFVRARLSDHLDLKLGRQIVIWGRSDNIRVTDVLNPLDLRAPGMTDIEDLRLPVAMSRLDCFFDPWSLSLYLIHEHRFNKLPVFGSDFYYLPAALPDDEIPSHAIDNTEFALALSGIFTGLDLSFYLADIYDDTAFLTAGNERRHERIKMGGFALSKAAGNFLLNSEAAVFDGIRLSSPQEGTGCSRLDFLAGFEYSGFTDTTLSFEVADTWFMNADSTVETAGYSEHNFQYALRVTRTFLRDRLEVTLFASLYGEFAADGGFLRTEAEYELTDSLALFCGIVFYRSGRLPALRDIGDNDRIFSGITHRF